MLGVATLLLLPAFLQLLQREGLMRKVRFTYLALAAAPIALVLSPLLRRPQPRLPPPEVPCKWDPTVDPDIPSTCPIRCGPSYNDAIPHQAISGKKPKDWRNLVFLLPPGIPDRGEPPLSFAFGQTEEPAMKNRTRKTTKAKGKAKRKAASKKRSSLETQRMGRRRPVA